MSEFYQRHIGPRPHDVQSMLKELGFSNLEEMASKVVPKSIRTKSKLEKVGPGMSEHELLKSLKKTMGKNQVFQSLIGMGFSNCITPTVIARNILENPVWYTAYTPYQPEISQGRLEALLNFQTMVTDLTGMEISNSSLLDEGSAAAEAMSMAHSLYKAKSKYFVVSPKMHPHVIEVLKTRSEPLGLEMILQEPADYNFEKSVFAVMIQYPATDGSIQDHAATAEKAHAHGAYVVVSADLLALTLLRPPGEWGADIVVGNSQRFGVPLGNGGPHAAFMATKDAHKRLMPGRLVGVSVDSHGKRALRLTLQTREQHIRREKATSNICTAQVLLANMASMYAVYHGPKGLTKIAERIHQLTSTCANALKSAGLQVLTEQFFDTLWVKASNTNDVIARATKNQINFRKVDENTLGISFDETCTEETLGLVLQTFGAEGGASKTPGQKIPSSLKRTSQFLTHPIFNTLHSEHEFTRYIYQLQNKDLTLTHSMIPLGSCTMKLNATTELVPVSWPEVNGIHPFAPANQMLGYQEMIADLELKLSDITGFPAISVQPNAGSQGEYAGLLAIRHYHQSRGQAHRKICLIPQSAHGTNPASAIMAGMQVLVVACDQDGNVDVADLRKTALAHKEDLAALMITYPSTHGVFEESITEICNIIHECGGQVYMDGANLNALVGLCKPGEFGPDVMHMNLHKTFAIPHGGGGPGVGPIGVAAHLAKFLPKPGDSSVCSAPWGSASILPISWAYITLMGDEGLRDASLIAILNANYLAKKLALHFPVLYKGREGMVAHECIIDLRPLKQATEIDVTDVAKRLMDFGFHAPTMSWPVAGTLMIEPTESESKEELDRFVEAMIHIRNEIRDIESKKVSADQSPLRHAPHTAAELLKTEWNKKYSREQAAFPAPWVMTKKYWPPVGRVDNAYGDRNVMCSCPPIEEYR